MCDNSVSDIETEVPTEARTEPSGAEEDVLTEKDVLTEQDLFFFPSANVTTNNVLVVMYCDCSAFFVLPGKVFLPYLRIRG